jgi:LmbE family N-acetylglucosaminyl deacetylase
MHYERVMVFGAHPDDELRMAAAIAKMSAGGTAVTVVIFTDGCEGYPRVEMKDTIVSTRAAESDEAQRVLGVQRYVNLGAADMGLVNSKENLKAVIRVIREARPQAIFTHGERERHRDHIATHQLSLEASWHAGEPVSADLGPTWRTPHLYYYKNTALEGPVVEFDVTDFVHVVPLAYATQVSQHVLFGRTREQYLADAERIKASPPRTIERFILHPWTVLRAFPALG